MALLRPGRCCCRRQGGCLQHRTEAQRRPKGQHAGGTPALPGDKGQDAGGTPALPGNHSPLEGESQKPSRQAKADAVGGVWQATSQKADLRPLGNSRLPASPAPAPHDGADHPRVKQVWFQASVVGEGAVRSGIKLGLFGTSRERWGTAAGAAVQRPVGKTPVSGDQRNQHPAAFIRMD